MLITTLKAANLKGYSFQHTLAPITVFVGNGATNSEGKTARLDAAQLALCGFHSLGKSNPAIALLSSSGSMGVHVTMSDGRWSERKWTEQKGSVKAEMNGDDLKVPGFVVSPDDFFALSAKDRMRLVFSLTASSAGNLADQFCARLRLAKNDEPTPETEAIVGKICGEASKNYLPDTPNDWLNSWVTLMRDAAKNARAAAERMTGTTQGLTELRAQAAPTQDLASIESELKAARIDLQKAQSLYDDLKRNEQEALRVKARKEQIQKELQAAPVMVDTEKLNTLRETVNGYKSVGREVLVKLQDEKAKLMALEADVKQYHAHCEELKGLMESLAQNPPQDELIASIEKHIAELEQAIHDANDVVRMRAALVKIANYPVHSEPMGGALDMRDIAEKALASQDTARFKADLVTARNELQIRKNTQGRRQYIGQNIQHLKERTPPTPNFSDIDVIQAAIGDLQNKLLDANNRDYQHEQNRKELGVLEAAARAAQEQQRKLELLQGELEWLPQLKLVLPEDKSDFEMCIKTLSSRVAQIEFVQKQSIAAKAEHAAKLRAAEEAEKARVEAAVYKAAVKCAEDLQAALVEKSFGSILSVANSICAGIMPPLEFRDGDVGYQRGRTFVTFKTFSGRERAVGYTAICVALAANSDARIALVDDLDKLPKDAKVVLFENVKRAIQNGHLHQFLGTDNREGEYAGIEGVTVVNVCND